MDNLTTRVLARVKNKQKGGGTKKHHRNLSKCKHYRESRYRVNKLRKLRLHLIKHVKDACAIAAMERLQILIS